MTAPEAQTKAKLRALLKDYSGIYTYWPVPFGYGRVTLDVLGCYRGRFFSVETKGPGKKPTLRQQGELENIGLAMGRTFVIAGTNSPVFDELRDWLDSLTITVPDDPHLPPDQVNRHAV